MKTRPVISAPLRWTAVLAARLPWKKNESFWPRSLKVTREGKWFIGVLLLIGFAAVNTGNNLLYLIVATMLSLIIISGLMSEAAVRGLKAERALPPAVFKGSPVRGRLTLRNTKKHTPSYSLFARDSGQVSSPAYFLKLRPGESASRTVEYVFNRRGASRLSGVAVTTRFPFGLFVKGKRERLVDEVIVYPSISTKPSAEAAAGLAPAGEQAHQSRGEGTGLYGLREYTAADDARHIHWMSAAKTSRLLVKEFEADAGSRTVIIFENYPAEEDRFEALVDEAASLASRYIELGHAVGLVTNTAEIRPGAGTESLRRILKELAFISPSSGHGTASVRVASS